MTFFGLGIVGLHLLLVILGLKVIFQRVLDPPTYNNCCATSVSMPYHNRQVATVCQIHKFFFSVFEILKIGLTGLFLSSIWQLDHFFKRDKKKDQIYGSYKHCSDFVVSRWTSTSTAPREKMVLRHRGRRNNGMNQISHCFNRVCRAPSTEFSADAVVMLPAFQNSGFLALNPNPR